MNYKVQQDRKFTKILDTLYVSMRISRYPQSKVKLKNFTVPLKNRIQNYKKNNTQLTINYIENHSTQFTTRCLLILRTLQ